MNIQYNQFTDKKTDSELTSLKHPLIPLLHNNGNILAFPKAWFSDFCSTNSSYKPLLGDKTNVMDLDHACFSERLKLNKRILDKNSNKYCFMSTYSLF